MNNNCNHFINLNTATKESRTNEQHLSIDKEIAAFDGGNQNVFNGDIFVANKAEVKNACPYQKPQNIEIPIYFNVTDPSENFTGRETYLKQLDVLSNQQTVDTNAKTHATVLSMTLLVTGTAGVGKTEIIRKFIHLYKQKYDDDNIVWIDSENFSTVRSCFFALAKELNVKFSQFNNDTTYLKSKVRKIYSILYRKKSLVVFDNAASYNDDQDGIQWFFPSSIGPKQITPTVIITSQRSEWSSIPIRTLPIQINQLTKNEAVTFIQNQLKEKNSTMALKLAQMVSRLPLALNQATKLIQNESKLRQVEKGKNYCISEFIEDIKTEKVGNHEGKLSPEVRFTFYDIWKVTLRRITNSTNGELAMNVLNYMACLSPTRIPKNLIYDLLGLAHYRKSDVTQALMLLCDYSLIQNNKNHFSVHRVAICEQLKARGDFDKVLVQLVCLFSPYLNSFPLDLKVNRNIVNNAEHLMSKFLLNKLDNIHIFKFVYQVSWSMRDTKPLQVEKNLNCLLQYTAKLETIDDGTIFELKNRLVHILDTHGKYKEAKELCDLTMQRFADRFPSNHPLQLYCQENLAHLHFFYGNFDEAKRIYSNVFDGKGMMLGVMHPETIKAGRCIGSMLRMLGMHTESENILLCTLEKAQDLFDKYDPRFLKLEQRYALTLHDLGNYDEALELLSTVLAAQVRIIGHRHKDTLTTKNGLAQTLIFTGYFEKALILLIKVYKSRRNILDTGHHDIVATSINLALVYTGLCEYLEALKIIYIALRKSSEHLGKNHPYTTVARVLSGKINNLKILNLKPASLTTEVFNSNFLIPYNTRPEFQDYRICIPTSVGITQVLLFDSVSATYGVQNGNAHLHVTWAKLSSGEAVKKDHIMLELEIFQKFLILVESTEKVPFQNVLLELVDVKTKNIALILPHSNNEAQTCYRLQFDVGDSVLKFNQISGNYQMSLCFQHPLILNFIKWNIGTVQLNLRKLYPHPHRRKIATDILLVSSKNLQSNEPFKNRSSLSSTLSSLLLLFALLAWGSYFALKICGHAAFLKFVGFFLGIPHLDAGIFGVYIYPEGVSGFPAALNIAVSFDSSPH